MKRIPFWVFLAALIAVALISQIVTQVRKLLEPMPENTYKPPPPGFSRSEPATGAKPELTYAAPSVPSNRDNDAKTSARTLMLRYLGRFEHNPAQVIERAPPFYLVKEVVGDPPVATYLVVVQLGEGDKFFAGPAAIARVSMATTAKEIEAAKRANGWPGFGGSPSNKGGRR